MTYEAVESVLAGTPQFKEGGTEILRFQINTKVNPVGNDKFDILQAITCKDKDGVAVWYEIDADKTSTILNKAAEYATAWVEEYYNK